MLRIGQKNMSYKALSGGTPVLQLLLLSAILPLIAGAAASSDPTSNPTSNPNSSLSSTSSAEQSSVSVSGQYPATSREQALYGARKSAGRANPLAPITGFKPFPSNIEVPPAVVELKEKPGQPRSRFNELLGKPLLPPPPPVSGQGDFPVSELPLPPDRPSIAAKLKLTGVIGDKAIFAITDREAIRVNKWPAVVMMAPGDRFESIETVSVGADSAILEEDGERSTKTLERIR